MTDKERREKYLKRCEEAKSMIDSPVLGEIGTPICKSCRNAQYHYGTLKSPECVVYGEMPKVYRMAHDYNCPHYDQIPNIDDAYLPKHMRKNNK